MEIFKKKNTRCCIKGSSLCKWLGREDCATCYIMQLSDKEQQEALEKWEVTQSLLPDGFNEVMESEDCQFCVKNPNKKTRYAMLDVANPEPENYRGMFFGLGKKVRTRIGSLLQLSIGCCDRCRRSFVYYDLIRMLTPVLFIAIAVLLLVIPSAASAIMRLGEFAVYVLLLVAIAAGMIAGRILAGAYARKKSREVRLNAYDIPLISQMRDKNWFLLQEDMEVTRLIFSRQRPRHANMVKMSEKEQQD